MTINEQLVEHEAFVEHAYQDSLGYWTIGVGRLIDKRKGGKISREEGNILLGNDINLRRALLDKHLPWWRDLDEVRQRVILDMAFNLGVQGLLGFKNTLGFIRQGNYYAAAVNMRQSKWYTQVGNRAERLVRMMITGSDVRKWW